MKFSNSISLILISAFITIVGCKSTNESITKTTLNAPEWSKQSVIYEVNVRQHTAEGTFKAFTKDIPRIKELGADILWIMPINPIGIKNRKGTLGSYYSVKNYTAINPEFGNLDDFKAMVKEAHNHGQKVIIDWVANHTSWDHAWITDHPEWYEKDSAGKIITQYDWSDVAKLNYTNTELRKAMIESMKFWVKECDIDGFRCDVAFLVPADFWTEARTELEAIKPVFMLAEMETQTDINPNPKEYYTNAFNANYSWSFHGLSSEIALGKKTYKDFQNHIKKTYTETPSDVYRMHFLTNHDENSWNGTVEEKYGDKWQLFSVLNYTLPQSFPLIYSGEEANNKKRLQFFEKDPITWGDTTLYGWYRKMNALKHNQPALANGKYGAPTKFINLNNTEDLSSLIVFERSMDGKSIYVVANMSNGTQSFKNIGGYIPSEKDIYVASKFENKTGEFILPAFGYILFTVNN